MARCIQAIHWWNQPFNGVPASESSIDPFRRNFGVLLPRHVASIPSLKLSRQIHKASLQSIGLHLGRELQRFQAQLDLSQSTSRNTSDNASRSSQLGSSISGHFKNFKIPKVNQTIHVFFRCFSIEKKSPWLFSGAHHGPLGTRVSHPRSCCWTSPEQLRSPVYIIFYNRIYILYIHISKFKNTCMCTV